MGIASLTLGIINPVTLIQPILGFSVSIFGIALSFLAFRVSENHRVKAVVGLLLCIVGLLANWTLVALGVVEFRAITDVITW